MSGKMQQRFFDRVDLFIRRTQRINGGFDYFHCCLCYFFQNAVQEIRPKADRQHADS